MIDVTCPVLVLHLLFPIFLSFLHLILPYHHLSNNRESEKRRAAHFVCGPSLDQEPTAQDMSVVRSLDGV